MPRTYPTDFDKVDRKMAADITPDNVFVTDMMVVVRWMDLDGRELWRLYNATSDNSVSSKIGLLELGKMQVVQNCGVRLFDVEEADGE